MSIGVYRVAGEVANVRDHPSVLAAFSSSSVATEMARGSGKAARLSGIGNEDAPDLTSGAAGGDAWLGGDDRDDRPEGGEAGVEGGTTPSW